MLSASPSRGRLTEALAPPVRAADADVSSPNSASSRRLLLVLFLSADVVASAGAGLESAEGVAGLNDGVVAPV